MILYSILTRLSLLERRLSFLIIFNISLISFFNSVWSIYLVDFNVLIGKTLATRFSIDLKMIGIFHILSRSAVVLPARVQPTQLLLRLLLVEDIQVGAVWGLDRYDQALVVRNPVLRVPCTAIVPDGQVFEVFIGDICIVSVLRVRKNLLLLFFEISYQIV